MAYIVIVVGICLYILNFILVYLWIQVQKIYVHRKNSKNDGKGAIDVDLENRKIIREGLKNCLHGLELMKIKQIGKIPSHSIRMVLYKLLGMEIQKRVSIYGECEFRGTGRIKIGEGTIIGNRCSIDGRNGVCIGQNVNLSTDVSIWSEQHSTQNPYFVCDATRNKTVVIGDRVWLSNHCIILPGVEIAQGAVIAAGAVVTKNVGEFEIWGGVPARKIGDRNHNLQYEFTGKHFWFI